MKICGISKIYIFIFFIEMRIFFIHIQSFVWKLDNWKTLGQSRWELPDLLLPGLSSLAGFLSIRPDALKTGSWFSLSLTLVSVAGFILLGSSSFGIKHSATKLVYSCRKTTLSYWNVVYNSAFLLPNCCSGTIP